MKVTINRGSSSVKSVSSVRPRQIGKPRDGAAMTIAIGARCQDGVALIAYRRMVRLGGLEFMSPKAKLSRIGDVVIARIGLRPFYDTLERALSRHRTVDYWNVSDAVDEIVARYAAIRNDSPVYPLALLVDGRAVLYQITASFPPTKVSYQVWGIGEEYGAVGRLFQGFTPLSISGSSQLSL